MTETLESIGKESSSPCEENNADITQPGAIILETEATHQIDVLNVEHEAGQTLRSGSYYYIEHTLDSVLK